MPVDPLGVTLTVPAGQSAIGVYEDAAGVQVFETDEPYLLSDGRSLEAPLPIFDAGGSVFQDSMGNAQTALAVTGLGPAPQGITWDASATWDNGTYWS